MDAEVRAPLPNHNERMLAQDKSIHTSRGDEFVANVVLRENSTALAILERKLERGVNLNLISMLETLTVLTTNMDMLRHVRLTSPQQLQHVMLVSEIEEAITVISSTQ